MEVISNFPESNLIATNIKVAVRTCKVKLPINFTLTIPSFSRVQFLEGFSLDSKLPPIDKAYSTSTRAHYKLAVKIALNNDSLFDASELRMLKVMLELRMSHCEKERDERKTVSINGTEIPIFNADSYIAMKILLLDIKELLLGDIVEYDVEG